MFTTRPIAATTSDSSYDTGAGCSSRCTDSTVTLAATSASSTALV